MQSFKWAFSYSAIFMVWCAGYLPRLELVSFLRKAKQHLIVDGPRRGRSFEPESFIFLLDNVLSVGEESVVVKGQQVRAEAELETIFRDAGLIVFARSERQPMPASFRDVVTWALY